MNAVDTNVFVYSLDASEPAKQVDAHRLLDRLAQPPIETILPWQVAGELLNCLRKWELAGRITPADVESHFGDVLAMFPLKIPSAASFQASIYGLASVCRIGTACSWPPAKRPAWTPCIPKT